MYKELEVRRGIMLLDEKKPDWRDSFDPGSLDMEDIDHCVLTQVFGGYIVGLSALGIDGSEYTHGFELLSTESSRLDEWNETWKQLVGQSKASPVY